MPLNVVTLVARVVADTSGFSKGLAGAQSELAATGESMQRTGRALTSSLTIPIIGVAAVATDFAIKFQRDMTMIHTQAGVATEKMAGLEKGIMALAPATRYGPDELANALYHIESVTSGTESNARALQILKVAADGAAVGNANLEDTASALIGTMRVFHEPASDATKVMGQLNAIVGAGNMRMTDLNHAIATGLMPTARSLGLNIADVGSALALMTDESTPAQVAATRMRTALLMMTGETSKSRKVMAELGMGTLEMAHDLAKPDGLVVALKDLEDHMKKISDPALRTQIIAEMFGGARSSGTILQWLNNLDMMHSKFDQINKTASQFPADVMATQATESFKLHQAWAAIQVVLVQIGGVIAPVVTALAVGISKVVEKFQQLPEGLQKIIIFGALAVAALGPLIWIGGTVLTTLSALADVVVALISPVGVVVAIIAALVAGFILLYQHSEAFRTAVTELLDKLKTDGMAVFNALKNIFSALASVFQGSGITWQEVGQKMAGVLHDLGQVAQVITQFLIQEFNSMASGIRAHSEEIRQTVKAAWDDIQAVTKVVWPYIKQIIEVTWAAVKIVVQTALQAIGQIILAIMAVIRGNWGDAWTHIKDAAVTILEGLAKLIWLILSNVVPLALKAALAIGEAIFKGIIKGIESLAVLGVQLLVWINKAINSVVDWAFNEAYKLGKSIADGIVSGVGGLATDLAHSVYDKAKSALSTVGGWFGIRSPSTYTRDMLGVPLGQGVVEGFLLGLNDLPNKLSAAIQDSLNKAKTAVQTAQSTLGTAFQNLATYAMQAFDARTTQEVTRMQAQFAAKLNRLVTVPLNQALAAAKRQYDAQSAKIQAMSDTPTKAQAALDAFQNADVPKTAEQQALDAMQEAHKQQQLQQALSSAQSQLATDQGSGADAQTILSDQQSLADALYNIQLDAAQKAADLANQAQADARKNQENALKVAANEANEAQKATIANLQKHLDEKYQNEQDGINKAYTQLTTALQAQETHRELDYTSQRSLQKQNLQNLLTDLQASLALHPKEWKSIQATIMRMFSQDFGPQYKTAGKNLGVGFAVGIQQADKDVTHAANVLNSTLSAALTTDYKDSGRVAAETFAGGIRSAIPDIEAAAREAAAAAAKYLKLHSPADEGPLSDLDQWWKPFVPTLLKGLDTSAIDKAVTGALSPSAMLTGIVTPQGNSLGQTGARDASGPLVNIEQQNNYHDLDPVLAANTIAKKVAYTS